MLSFGVSDRDRLLTIASLKEVANLYKNVSSYEFTKHFFVLSAIAHAPNSSEEIYQTTMTYWLFQGNPKYYRSKQATK
ncbi:MAG: hypothetical protein KME54_25095 [Tolypothrix brevis GSE-NOS-MK-07-07A]|nr:hypothetical protein [Tolypothrix brevis GSE-NOS-MK-07-07A]